MNQHKKDALILLPGNDQFREPGWDKLKNMESLSKYPGYIIQLPSRPPSGDLYLIILYCYQQIEAATLKLSGISQEHDKALLETILQEFSNVPLPETNRKVICGHFSQPITYIREILNEIEQDASEYQTILSFRDSIMGVGKTVLASYTLRGTTQDRATKIIDKCKQRIQRDSEFSEEIGTLLRTLFDYLWRKTKVTRLTELIRTLFMICQTNGRCGDQTKLRQTFRKILDDKDSYMLEGSDLELMRKFVDAGNLLDFSEREKQGVFNLLDRLIKDSM
jgi:hypothetical protein